MKKKEEIKFLDHPPKVFHLLIYSLIRAPPFPPPPSIALQRIFSHRRSNDADPAEKRA